MRASVVALGSVCLAAFVLPAACARPACDTPSPVSETAMNPELRRAIAENPDTVIGVLLRTTRTLGDEERIALRDCGLAVQSVVGDVVTGRIRADAAPGLASLPFVRYIELARSMRIPPPPLPPEDTGTHTDTSPG